MFVFVFTYCLAAKYNGHLVEFFNASSHSRLVVDGKPEAFYNGYSLKEKENVLEAEVGGTTFRAVMIKGLTTKVELYGGQTLLAEGTILS